MLLKKSITVIIDALKEVVALNDNIRFLIVGGGPQLEELKNYVKDDHIESYVIFTGCTSTLSYFRYVYFRFTF